VPTASAFARAGTRIEASCQVADNARVLREEILLTLRAVIPFDAYVWVLTDPETWVGADPLADASDLITQLPRLIRLKYLTAVNRWTTMDGPVAFLLGTTAGQPQRSLVWRELLDARGIVDVASCRFVDRYGCWAFLDLWRRSPFSHQEEAFLRSVVEPITAGLRRCQAGTFVTAAGTTARTGPVVLLLAPDLTVLAETPATVAHLEALLPRTDGGPPVPASALNVAAQLLAVEAGVDERPPSARVHLGDGVWLRLRAVRMGHPDLPMAERDIAVVIEVAGPAERLSLYARAHGLTTRETELLGHLSSGGPDTREVAHRMAVSEHTVQDHLKSIFAKTGTASRATVVARAIGG
jgi:DNA-binding CsgD family transcriptional regulator